jgi:hypothetical protein
MRRTSRGRVRLCSTLTVLLLVVLPVATASAWDGERPPDDPLYDVAERQPIGHTFHDEQWFMYSFIPRTAPLATDPEGAAGMSIDLAWRRYGTGRPDVRVAYIEGGVNWRDGPGRRELAPRSYLNTGELPLPAGTKVYDANGDGQVNVNDYAGDPRIHRPYLHGEITPEDAIAAFSNGRDEDGNGYVDDIAGWNFFRANNDPQTEDSAYTHANNQMRRAVAEGDNGFAGVGICPHCTVIPIKAGHEALVRPDRLAQSIFFAVDSGASVVVAVVAELGYTPLVRRALDYAWRKGVVVVEASNDFNSADHQAGMFWPRVWPGNALVADTTGQFGDVTAGFTTGFRNRSNYTSFGPHSLFSMPTMGGTTSEATPTQGGVAALIAAFGRKAADEGLISSPLDAGEIKQVLRAASSPIQSLTAHNHPGRPGATFSLNYGYGRPNANRALDGVLGNRIPPVPDILAPSWYAIVDPTRTAGVPVTADIRARRARRFTWTVQWALGAEPVEADFRTLRTGTVVGRRVTGRLATLDLSLIPRSFWERALEHTADLSSTEQHTITLRVQATDDRNLMGEDRRAFAVVHDPAWRPGFPRFMGLGKEAPPVPADLNGDGAAELIFGGSDGAVHALGGRGRELPGWPTHTQPLDLGLQRTAAGRAHAVPFAREPIATPAAIGDLDGDGRPEVVATTLTGRIYVFDARGRLRPGWPKQLGAHVAGLTVPPPDRPYTRLPSEGAYASPVLAPLPGGSRLDVLQGAWDGKLYAFDAGGRPVSGWPVDAQLPAESVAPPAIDVHDYKIAATPTLADLDGDGRMEIVVKSQEFALRNQDVFGLGSSFFVQAFHGDGNAHPGGARVSGWPVEVQGVLGAYGTAQDFITEGGDSATAADIDSDGADEVLQPLAFAPPAVIDGGRVVHASAAARARSRARLALRHGAVAPAAPAWLVLPVGFTTSGTMARFAGGLAYASGGTDLISLASLLFPGQPILINNGLRLMDPRTAAARPGFPAPMMGLPFLTAPAVADISGDGRPDVVNGTDTSNVTAAQEDGTPVPGWPKFTGGWTLFTPAVADLGRHGSVAVAATTREGYLYVWDTSGRRADVQAPTWQQDVAHTGRLGSPVP